MSMRGSSAITRRLLAVIAFFTSRGSEAPSGDRDPVVCDDRMRCVELALQVHYSHIEFDNRPISSHRPNLRMYRASHQHQHISNPASSFYPSF